MEEIKKYNPEQILLHAHRKRWGQPDYKIDNHHEYQVLIEIKDEDNGYYGITHINLSRLESLNSRPGNIKDDPQTLKNDKDKLGKVFIRWKEKEIDKYDTLDEFWDV